MDDDALTREQLLDEVRALRTRVAAFEQAAATVGDGGCPPPAGGPLLPEVFDHAFGFIGILTADGTLLEVNRSPLDLAGFRREQVLGRPFWDTGWWDRSPEVQAQLRADFAEALRGRPVRRESVYFTAGGEERVVDRTLTPVADRDGRVVRVIAEGRDVTDRKRAEEATARAERRFRALVEHQFDGITLNAADGTVLYISPSARRMVGFTDDQVVGRSAFDFIHPDDQARATQLLAEVLKSPRTPFRIEYRARRRDESWRWLETVVQNLLDEPAVGALVCNYRDVTDQRQAEAARRENEARFLGIFHQSAAGVAECDPAGRFVRVNARVCEMLGRSEAELYRLRVHDVTHPDDLPSNLELLEWAVRDGRPFTVEKRYVRPDGTHVWANTSVCAIPGPDGRTGSVMGVAIDITERKLAEEALRRARDDLEEQVRERTAELEAERGRLAEVFRLAPSFMAVFRGPGHVLERANDRFAQLTGGRVPTGRTVREGFPEVEGQGFFEALDRVYRTGEPFAGTDARMRLRRGSGSLDERILEFVYQPLRDASGAVAGILAQGIDQTDRVRADEALRESADRLQTLSRRLLEVQEAERRHLARELHDEVGQLLMGLRLLLKPDGGVTSEAVRANQEQARVIVDGLLKRIRGLSFDLRPAVLDQLGLLPGLLALFERYTEQTRVLVNFKHQELGQRFPPDVETTAYRIVQEALTNVARHAGVAGVTVRVWAADDVLNVQVEDRGSGFDAGLALAMSLSGGLAGMRERVRLLDGHLMIESRPGDGTRITAELPLEPIVNS